MALGVPGTIAARRWIGAEWLEGRSPDSGAADHGASGSLVAQNGIYLSQLGFLTSMPKLATINSGGKSFAVRSKRDASIILRNALSNPILDEASGDQVQIADFSARKTPGVYFLEIDDSRKSAAFVIGDDVLRHRSLAHRALLLWAAMWLRGGSRFRSEAEKRSGLGAFETFGTAQVCQ